MNGLSPTHNHKSSSELLFLLLFTLLINDKKSKPESKQDRGAAPVRCFDEVAYMYDQRC
jgi:hypothetical protein